MWKITILNLIYILFIRNKKKVAIIKKTIFLYFIDLVHVL